tara:strand:+ start:598 stop:822 length:225 start_codon:yes stop_codon:yes gene_type:complete
MRYRDLIANELRSWKQQQKDFKKFTIRSGRINRMLDRANRPRDKIGRVIKKNVWGDEIVRVKNKWTLRSEVDGS